MRAFAKLTRWTTLISFLVMAFCAVCLLTTFIPILFYSTTVMLLGFGSAFIFFWSFVIMVISNFVGVFVTSDRHDRAEIYASKQYRVKLEN